MRQLGVKSIAMNISLILQSPFKRDFDHYPGVPRIKIYLLRLLFTLMFLFVSFDFWKYILKPYRTLEVGTGSSLVHVGSLLSYLLRRDHPAAEIAADCLIPDFL
jgi:hypothetical protein